METKTTGICDVKITFTMRNDYETLLHHITIPMKYSRADCLIHCLEDCGNATQEDISAYYLTFDLATTAAILAGYSLERIISAEIVND